MFQALVRGVLWARERSLTVLSSRPGGPALTLFESGPAGSAEQRTGFPSPRAQLAFNGVPRVGCVRRFESLSCQLAHTVDKRNTSSCCS